MSGCQPYLSVGCVTEDPVASISARLPIHGSPVEDLLQLFGGSRQYREWLADLPQRIAEIPSESSSD